MDGSNGKMVVLLERIALGVEDTNKRLDQTNERLDQTNERIDRVIAQMNIGFMGVHARQDAANARFDNALEFLGRHHDDHEERIRALEARVFAKSGS